MLRGLWKLTWIEIKIFLREPLGAFGTIVVPVVLFLVLGRIASRGRAPAAPAPIVSSTSALPVLASLLIAISAVLSLVTIISIYREGGILKRLRATPLRPQTILTAHVHRQAATHRRHARPDGPRRQALLPGRRCTRPVLLHHRAADQHLQHPVHRLSHRQHRPYRALCSAHRRVILYPMFVVSDSSCPSPHCRRSFVSRALPLTYAVSLLQGIWNGEAWSAHLGDIAALALDWPLHRDLHKSLPLGVATLRNKTHPLIV